jgi:hypothetical protein
LLQLAPNCNCYLYGIDTETYSTEIIETVTQVKRTMLKLNSINQGKEFTPSAFEITPFYSHILSLVSESAKKQHI